MHVRHTIKKKTLCVGIISTPLDLNGSDGSSHIAKKYVDWMEDNGVHVIPIPYDTTEHEKYFNIINGLLIVGNVPGEIMKNTTYIECVTKFFILSLREYFPIWGICAGFQMLLCLVGGIKLKNNVLSGLYPIKTKKSRMFTFSPKYIDYLENYKSAFHSNHYGISSKDFLKNKHIKRFYNITSTCKEYVSSIESKYYPIYGTQWHPENHRKTFKPFADFFISELKKSKHSCKNRKLSSILKPKMCSHCNELCYF